MAMMLNVHKTVAQTLSFTNKQSLIVDQNLKSLRHGAGGFFLFPIDDCSIAGLCRIPKRLSFGGRIKRPRLTVAIYAQHIRYNRSSEDA